MHSVTREPRSHAVPCRKCRRTATFDFDRMCGGCHAAQVPFRDGTDGSYFLLDLDTTSVPVPAFGVNPDDVLAELLNALND